VLNDAIGYASAALLAFETMDNASGAIRARCLLADALIEAGNLAEARDLVEQAERALSRLSPSGDTFEPLTARLRRSQGRLDLAVGDVRAACGKLEEAVRIFASNGDWHSQADTLVWVGKARRAAAHPPTLDGAAIGSLGEALDFYTRSGDRPAADTVRALIASWNVVP
jgi:tetratricopeptide (TPR) repeat protein